MSRPTFTPDPLPGGDKQDPVLVEWMQRQFQRIADWWPVALEDRVRALEGLFTTLPGEWVLSESGFIEAYPEQIRKYDYLVFGVNSDTVPLGFSAAILPYAQETSPVGDIGGTYGYVRRAWTSEDRETVVLACRRDSDLQTGFLVYNTITWELKFPFVAMEYDAGPWDIAVDVSETNVVFCSKNSSTARFTALNIKTGVKVTLPTLPIGATFGASFSPDGQYLAISHSGSGSNGLSFYSTTDWSDVGNIHGLDFTLPDAQALGFHSISYSPDGRYLACGNRSNYSNSPNKQTFFVWDLYTGELLPRFTGHPTYTSSFTENRSEAVAWSHNSRYVAWGVTVLPGGVSHFWLADVWTGEFVTLDTDVLYSVRDIVFHPDNVHVIVCADTKKYIFNLLTMEAETVDYSSNAWTAAVI